MFIKIRIYAKSSRTLLIFAVSYFPSFALPVAQFGNIG
jgi:hypothetical protein